MTPAVKTPAPVVNAANGLTLLRIVLIPVFAVLMVASGMTEPGYRIGAAFAFGIASLTDFADGWLARSMNQVTPFVQIADPIADKALTGTALVCCPSTTRCRGGSPSSSWCARSA